MVVPVTPNVASAELPRPKDVGVLGMEVYFPRRVSRDYRFTGEIFG